MGNHRLIIIFGEIIVIIMRGVNSQNARRGNAQSRLNEEAAFRYPIIIPAPSQLGENHLRQFFEANRKELFRNQKHFRMALIRADNDERMSRLLSLQTQQRPSTGFNE